MVLSFSFLTNLQVLVVLFWPSYKEDTVWSLLFLKTHLLLSLVKSNSIDSLLNNFEYIYLTLMLWTFAWYSIQDVGIPFIPDKQPLISLPSLFVDSNSSKYVFLSKKKLSVP